MFSKLQELREEREEGFTLIELLVVILIIGILSAIAIPAFLNQRKSAVDSSVQSDVSNAAKQVETFVVKSGSTVKALSANGDGIKDIKVSDGTTLKIVGNTFHYTIQGTNPGGDKANNGTGYIYDSQKGGNTSALPATYEQNTVKGNITVEFGKAPAAGTAPTTP
ncbi:MAG: prepilin-type N-terminal cleavage/methylation domain-containing protein [Enterococcus sp.]|nr:prepilin-type N-terminal cleavage/methylation domain-containing protein [Enterococcus sp.]